MDPKMTEAEINEAVARKLGWYKTDLGWEHKKDWKRHEDHLGVFLEKKAYPELPDYCYSIEAAWEIVEWIKNKGGALLWKPYFELGASGNGWTCRIRMNPHEHADTAPMAICFAFLKLPQE